MVGYICVRITPGSKSRSYSLRVYLIMLKFLSLTKSAFLLYTTGLEASVAHMSLLEETDALNMVFASFDRTLQEQVEISQQKVCCSNIIKMNLIFCIKSCFATV